MFGVGKLGVIRHNGAALPAPGGAGQLPNVGPFRGLDAPSISGLPDQTLVGATIPNGDYLNPNKYKTLTLDSGFPDPTTTANYSVTVWCDKFDLSSSNHPAFNVNGGVGDSTGDASFGAAGGVGWAGGGGGAVATAFSGNPAGGTGGPINGANGGQAGIGVVSGTGGVGINPVPVHTTSLPGFGDMPAGGGGTPGGGTGGIGGQAHALDDGIDEAGGGGGGGAGNITIIANEISGGSAPGSVGLYANGGAPGSGVDGGSDHAIGVGGSGGVIYVACRVYDGSLAFSVGAGSILGSDGAAYLYEILEDNSLVLHSTWTDTWDNRIPTSWPTYADGPTLQIDSPISVDVSTIWDYQNIIINAPVTVTGDGGFFIMGCKNFTMNSYFDWGLYNYGIFSTTAPDGTFLSATVTGANGGAGGSTNGAGGGPASSAAGGGGAGYFPGSPDANFPDGGYGGDGFIDSGQVPGGSGGSFGVSGSDAPTYSGDLNPVLFGAGGGGAGAPAAPKSFYLRARGNLYGTGQINCNGAALPGGKGGDIEYGDDFTGNVQGGGGGGGSGGSDGATLVVHYSGSDLSSINYLVTGSSGGFGGTGGTCSGSGSPTEALNGNPGNDGSAGSSGTLDVSQVPNT